MTLDLTICNKAGSQYSLNEWIHYEIPLSGGKVGVGHEIEWDPEIGWVHWDLLHWAWGMSRHGEDPGLEPGIIVKLLGKIIF